MQPVTARKDGHFLIGKEMCENKLIVERSTNKPIEIEPTKHKVSYIGNGIESVLLDGIYMKGVINYASVYDIKDTHGVKSGYMIIIGDKA